VQLLLALAGCGRRAEALDAYQQARRVLVDELGIEPGPDLQLVHQRILAGDPPLSAAPAPGPDAADHEEPTPAPPPVGTVKRRRRADAGIVVLAIASAAALVTAVTFAVVHTSSTDPPAPAPAALYYHCPVGDFCLFNGKDGSTSYCTWLGSDPTADHSCDWLRRGWKVRSVYNRMSVTVEYCAQEHYQACVGATPPGGFGNLPATYTVRSVRVE
jgi:hypothetical protein